MPAPAEFAPAVCPDCGGQVWRLVQTVVRARAEDGLLVEGETVAIIVRRPDFDLPGTARVVRPIHRQRCPAR